MTAGRAGLAGLVLAGLVLAACQTTGGGPEAYEAPLRRAGVLSAAAGEAAAPAAGGPRFEVAADAIAYEDDTYRIEDLAPGQRPAADTREGGLWYALDKYERNARTSGQRVDDAELDEYIAGLVCKVADTYCLDVRAYVMRVPEFNASMAPNGMMSVWTGLLLRVRNEAQLAAVLGHEAGHYLRRHSLQQMDNVISTTNFLAFFSVATGLSGVPVGTVAQMIAMGQISAYSRDHEREADGYGLLLVSQAGYDPREVAKVWENLIAERDAEPDAKDPPLFFASHPPSEERQDVLADLGARVAATMDAPELGRERFLEIVLPRRAVWMHDEVRRNRFERSMALFDIMLDGDPNPAEILFFKGELHRVRDQDGDREAALALYARALDGTGTVPGEIHRSRGIVLARRGDGPAAAAALKRYLETVPDASDRLLVEDMIKRLEIS